MRINDKSAQNTQSDSLAELLAILLAAGINAEWHTPFMESTESIRVWVTDDYYYMVGDSIDELGNLMNGFDSCAYEVVEEGADDCVGNDQYFETPDDALKFFCTLIAE